MLRISVVVPAFRSTEHLDELVASLDAQTLPQSDFEVLLIDDGSPDDTYRRLLAFAATRPNYRAFGLPPSGWPSRPRNHGIDEARGEYIVFMDHDDRLFPDALRAAYALASRAGADVLDGKESRSDSPGWAMRHVQRDVENAIDWIDPHPLLPMNPHKMFRTRFLRDEGIRFPEGGRQIWEDISFDIAAHARARVVSLLVETPFYLWHRPEHQTTSGTFYDDPEEYLSAIDRVFGWIEAELGPRQRFDALRERFLAYQLRMRVLPLFGADHRGAERSSADRERIRAFTGDLLPRVSKDADLHLDPWRRVLLALLRAGRFDLAERQAATWPRLVCTTTARGPRWTGAGLRFDADIVWRLEAGSSGADAVTRVAGRALLILDSDVAAFASAQGLSLDVTEELQAAEFAIDRRSRTEKIDWTLAAGTGARLAPSDAGDLLVATAPTTWHVVDDGPGRLHDGVWDFYIRAVVLRTRVVRQIRVTDDGHRWAAVAGRLAVAYRSRNGCLSVDVGQTMLNVLDDGRPSASSKRGADGIRIVVDLPHVQVLGPVDVVGSFVTREGTIVAPCRVTVHEGRARLIGTVPAGARELHVAFGESGAVSRTRLAVDTRGRVSVRTSRPSTARRAWQMLPEGVRRRVWRWRHRR